MFITTNIIFIYIHIWMNIGNGKIKTKEPMEMATKAISQLKEVTDVANAI